MPSLEGNRTRIVWACWMLFAIGALVRGYVQPHRANCYSVYYHDAAGNWWQGRDLYGAVTQTCRYSPLVHAGFGPLSLLDARTAATVWRLVGAVGLLTALYWWMRTALPTDWSDRRRALLLLLTIPLMLPNLNSGQSNTLVLAGILGCVAAINRERFWLAAACLSVSCFIKIYPLAISMLLIVLYPRQFTWRFAATLLAGALLPFLLHDSEYVARQHGRWLGNLRDDDRSQWTIETGYRDGWMLLRLLGTPMAVETYRALTLLIGAAVGLLTIIVRRRGPADRELLNRVVGLGCCWMTVFGPATEGHTYILASTTLLLFAFVAGDGRLPGWARPLALVAFVGFFGAPLVQATPWRQDLHYGIWVPVGTLALFAMLVGLVAASRGAPAALVQEVVEYRREAA